MSHRQTHLSIMRQSQTERSLSRRRVIHVCPASAFKTHSQRTHDVGTRTDGFLKASTTTRNNVGAYSAQRGIARSLSAFRACH